VANSIRTFRNEQSHGTKPKALHADKDKRSLIDVVEDDNSLVSEIYRATKIQRLDTIVDNDDSSMTSVHAATRLRNVIGGGGGGGCSGGSTTAAGDSDMLDDVGAFNAIARGGDGGGGGAVPLLVNSLCPLIYGHELVKLGLLLGLFGGTSSDSHKGSAATSSSGGGGRNEDMSTTMGHSPFSTRSDIHVLIVGDPGLGKSQLLRSAAAVAPKSVFVCGNTATTAGLTVSLSRDSGGGGAKGGGGGGADVCIEAGALVLADRGVCCIDELDKMACDPHSMLEAMEQQQISIAKSGVVTSLKSRTSILAAANPVGGHYNRNKSVSLF
jgi:hypothetical protein